MNYSSHWGPGLVGLRNGHNTQNCNSFSGLEKPALPAGEEWVREGEG